MIKIHNNLKVNTCSAYLPNSYYMIKRMASSQSIEKSVKRVLRDPVFTRGKMSKEFIHVTAATTQAAHHWKIPLLFPKRKPEVLVILGQLQGTSLLRPGLGLWWASLHHSHIIPSFIARGMRMDHLTKPHSPTPAHCHLCSWRDTDSDIHTPTCTLTHTPAKAIS